MKYPQTSSEKSPTYPNFQAKNPQIQKILGIFARKLGPNSPIGKSKLQFLSLNLTVEAQKPTIIINF